MDATWVAVMSTMNNSQNSGSISTNDEKILLGIYMVFMLVLTIIFIFTSINRIKKYIKNKDNFFTSLSDYYFDSSLEGITNCICIIIYVISFIIIFGIQLSKFL